MWGYNIRTINGPYTGRSCAKCFMLYILMIYGGQTGEAYSSEGQT